MKKITLLLFISCISLSIFAQGFKKRTPEEKAKYYTDEMAKDINLEKDQETKIFDINLIVSKQFDSLFATKPDADTRRKGSIAIYRERDEAFKKILSKKQFLQYDDIQREKREKRKLENEEKQKAASTFYQNKAATDSLSEKK